MANSPGSVFKPDTPLVLPDEASLLRVAAYWIHTIDCPAHVYLYGDLGAGKSTFVRAALHALGYSGKVKSPTFSLLESYPVGERLACHMDLYRLLDPEELEFTGFRDLLAEADYLFIEWPERAAGVLPQPHWRIHIDYLEQARETGRRLTVSAAAPARR